MNALLEKLHAISTSFWTRIAWLIRQVIIWAAVIAAVVGGAASLDHYGLWNTFVGASLIVIMLLNISSLDKISAVESRFSALAQETKLALDLVKGPPKIRRIRAAELKPGMYLFGTDKIVWVEINNRTGRVMVSEEDLLGEIDEPSFFDSDEIVEVTERSLLDYEEGEEQLARIISGEAFGDESDLSQSDLTSPPNQYLDLYRRIS